MAKGYDNLIPLNRRSKDVQRAIQEKGRQANREKWKQKIDLRNSVQNFLNGDYTVDGETMTGEEWFIKKVLEALSNTKNQNWKAAAELIVSLSESGKAGAEVERINAEPSSWRLYGEQFLCHGRGSKHGGNEGAICTDRTSEALREEPTQE